MSAKPPLCKKHFYQWLAVLVPFGLFLLHSLMFRTWIIDDAGITYAYAHNLANGHGLVSQPGFPHVEGYSNFLWMILLAPTFILGLFHPIITAKIMGAGFALATFWIINKLITKVLDENESTSAFALFLIAANTPFAIWMSSGLENPLYAFFVTCLLYLSAKLAKERFISLKGALLSGLIVSGLAMTRPDGIAYCILLPLEIIILAVVDIPKKRKGYLSGLAVYAATMLILVSSFMIFRFLYFHDVVPNTFHAKGGPGLAQLKTIAMLHIYYIDKIHTLCWAVVYKAAGLAMLVIPMLTINQLTLRQMRSEHLTLLAFVCFSAGIYLVMPYDWMPEYRFATPFVVSFYCYTVVLAKRAISLANWQPKIKMVSVLFLALFAIAIVGGGGYKHSSTFMKDPTVPLREITSNAIAFNQYAQEMGLNNASLLTPDLGGHLCYSKLRIFDMAGLCDKTIAKVLREKNNQNGARNYIFEVVKPTFIHLHSSWGKEISGDERLKRDYVLAKQYSDASSSDMDLALGNVRIYVRKDAVGTDPKRLAVTQRIKESAPPYFNIAPIKCPF